MITNREIPLESWQDHPRNYNLHPEDQIQEIMASLEAFGQVRSVVAQIQADGSLLGVAGHGVVEAARRLGMESLRADVIPEDWTEVQVQAYLATDNELARGASPDEAQLRALVKEIHSLDAELARLAAGGEEALRALAIDLQDGQIILPDPAPHQEPELESEVYIEIYCSAVDLEVFDSVLADWGKRDGVTVNVS